jgi:hypothetical protein
MNHQARKRFVRACALGALAAAGLVTSGATAPLAGAAQQVPHRQQVPRTLQLPTRNPSCTWPVSIREIDASLGVSVKSAVAPMQFTEPTPEGKVRWMLCAYYSNGTNAATGSVFIEYFGGVGNQQLFTFLERGFDLAKHISHVTTVHGIGSEAFYAIASHQTYLFVHVGTTMFIVFAPRPPAKVIVLGKILAHAL